MTGKLLLAAVCTVSIASVPLAAQTPASPTRPTSPTNPTSPTDAASAPVECWWKTDRSAVRVGEPFSLTLTCAVLDTERVKAIIDESGLAPSALHLTPFEVTGGRRFRDIPNYPRRFFQYQYSVRILGEEFFGQEVTLPRLQLSYRVQNSLEGGDALQGREAQYSLVPVPVRVLSLVPAGATAIRDTPPDTFGDVDARLFRSNVLFVVAAAAFGFALLLLVALGARAVTRRSRASAARRREPSPLAALRAASRELAAVRDAAAGERWTPELAGRAASALRLGGAIALERPVTRVEVERRAQPREGQVAGAPGLAWLRGRQTMYSAAVTPHIAGNGAHAGRAWETLSGALRTFTAAHYGRNGDLDGAALDAALADGADSLRRVQIDRLLRFRWRRHSPETPHGRQTWAR